MKRFFSSFLLSVFSFLVLASTQAYAAQTAALLPISAGNYQQWSPKDGSNHVTMVDETICNGTTDFNRETTLTERDSYGISLTSIPDGSTITQIDITPCASRNVTGTGSSTLDVFYRLNGVDSADAGAYALPVGITPAVLSVTSFTGFSATKSSSTTFEIGGVYSAGTRGVRISQLKTTITYTQLATPSSLTAIGAGANVNLNWIDNASNEDGFKIERSDNGGAFTEIDIVGANVTTYNDPSLSTGTYAYRIRSYNSGGNSAYTATATAYVLNAPSALSASASASTVSLNWTDNSSNEDGFRVEIATGAGAFAFYKNVGVNVTSTTAPNLSQNTYSFRVRAYKSTSYSDYSNTDSAQVLSLPTGLTGTISGSYDITLNWNDNASGEDGYTVERSDNGGAYAEIASLAANSTSHFDSGLAAGNTYAYRVRAFTSGGDVSGNASVTVVVMNAPSGLTALASGTAATSSAIQLSWTDNSSNESGFEIERAIGGGEFSSYVFVAGNVTNFTTVALPVNTYSFRVRAYNGSSRSSYSNTADTIVLSAPSGLGTNVSGSDVTLSWTDNGIGEDGFRVERSDNGGGYIEIGTVGTDVTTYFDPGLALGSYDYRVRAYKAANTSIYSASASAIIP